VKCLLFHSISVDHFSVWCIFNEADDNVLVASRVSSATTVESVDFSVASVNDSAQHLIDLRGLASCSHCHTHHSHPFDLSAHLSHSRRLKAVTGDFKVN
jgi:hypothetical protein